MGRVLEIGPASSEYYGEIEANNSIVKVFGPIPHFPAPMSDLHYPLPDETGRFNKSNHRTLIALAGISGTLAGCVQFGALAQEVRDFIEYNSADPSQVPDQIAGEAAAVPESVGDRFDAFLNKYENADVGFDEITSLWVKSLGMSSDSIYDFLYDAGPFERFNNPPDYIKEHFEVILNERNSLPMKGDIIFTYPNSNNASGIMIIAAEEAGKDPDGTSYGKVFANYNVDTLDFRSGWIPRVQFFNVENAIAWLRPKAIAETNGQGEVLGASTQRVDILLPFPEGETWALTGSSHGGGSLDWAPWKPTACASDGTFTVPKDRITIDEDSWVTASISGVVREISGKEATDPGVLVIERDDGVEVVYRHVLLTEDEIKNKALEIDKKVKAGEPLIHPACIGKTSGRHVDTSVRVGGKKLPAEDVTYSGWVSKPAGTEHNGTLEKVGEETRTANVYRCVPPNNNNKQCEGGRNDVTNSGETTEPSATEQPTIPEFENPQDEARHQLAIYLFDYLQKTNMELHADWVREEDYDTYFTEFNQSLESAGTGLEELALRLALGEEIDTLLTYKWDYRYMADYQGEKAFGISYINNLQMSSEFEESLSDADMANGLIWKGRMNLAGIAQFGIIHTETEGGIWHEANRVRKWLGQEPDYDSIDRFSRWVDISKSFDITLYRGTDGKPQINISCIKIYYGDCENEPPQPLRAINSDDSPAEGVILMIFDTPERDISDGYEKRDITP